MFGETLILPRELLEAKKPKRAARKKTTRSRKRTGKSASSKSPRARAE